SNDRVEFSGLAREYNPVNLGQGFPDLPVPNFLKEAMITAVTSNDVLHQYTRGPGHPRLINALTELYEPLHRRKINSDTDILVTVGGYGSLYCSIMGLINPGDEVIVIEPFFDCYVPFIKIAGGKPICIPLRTRKNATTSADFYLDEQELRSAFSDKTKCIIINTPHNPTGKVFSLQELEVIAELCIKNNTICISDEVYEWLVYPGISHIRIATLPEMNDRTVTIGSAGKAFSVTGWKTGWSIGPPHLMKHLHAAHTNSIYTCQTVTQEAVAIALENEIKNRDSEDSYLNNLPKILESKRNQMVRFLSEADITPIVPEGGYFMMADVSKLGIEFDDDDDKSLYDYKFSRWLIKKKGIACIPPSAFYSEENKALSGRLIRFCFIKVNFSYITLY
ncbi:uncharacterized protein TRIADDRAFT_28708, partial [Trichoplax adhaerens]